MDWIGDFIWGNYEPANIYDHVGIGEIVNTAFSNMNNRIIQWIVNQIISISDLLIDIMLEIPLKYMNSPGFKQLYLTITKLTFVIIAPIIMYFGFKMLTGRISEQELWESIKRFFFLPFFIILTPIFTRESILIVNRISNTLLSTSQQQIALYPEEIGAEFILITVIYSVYLTRILLWYALRNAKLIFLILTSPLLYLMGSLPKHFQILAKWQKDIVTLLLTQIAHIIQILILVTVTRIDIGVFEEMLFQVGCLILMSKTENWLVEQLGGNTTRLPELNTKKIFNSAKKIIEKVIK